MSSPMITTATITTLLPSPSQETAKTVTMEAGSGNFHGSVNGNIKVNVDVPAETAGNVTSSGGFNPYKGLYPDSILTHPQHFNVDSATIGIIAVAIVFGTVLLVVGLWKLRERRELPMLDEERKGKEEVL